MRRLVLFAVLSACAPQDSGKPANSSSDSGVASDGDGDGYALDQDCDDANADIHPGAAEVCNDVDDDCDDVVDDDATDGSTYYEDADADGAGTGERVVACAAPTGFAAADGDCDDTDPATNPGAEESDCADPHDYNCDGSVAWADADADGVAACEDCDDTSPLVHPGAVERCDGLDNDCNAAIDDAAVDATAWYADDDADGYGTGTPLAACDAPVGHVAPGGDCDDANAAFHPAATEDDCTDSNDYNCDESVGYADADADGFPACDDCDDAAAAVNRDAVEVCDGVDNDCEGTVDLAATDALTYYADVDADGYGDFTATVADCSAPSGHVADATDCNDGDAAIYPGAEEPDCTDPTDYNCDGSVAYEDIDDDGFPACEDCNDTDSAVSPSGTELCDGIDNDCSGTTDEDSAADALTWYVDADDDAYGYAPATWIACEQPAGYVVDATDCDDADVTAHPGGTEVCGGGDENCDGAVDEGDAVGAVLWYADSDSDTFGDGGVSVSACDVPAGYTADSSDCDDLDPAVNAAATEVCDFIDNNCDTEVDEASADDAATWYADTDSDTFGDAAEPLVACDVPSGYVADATDCNDAVGSTFPGGTEVCGGEDEDCDGATDDAGADGELTFYEDLDADTYGSAVSALACTVPSGFVANDEDCDDSDAAISPDATEVCDTADTDEDCDEAADGASAAGQFTWYLDDDNDGYAGALTTSACDVPAGYLATSTDCDDGDAAINPAATEACDSADTDEDCDGTADDASATGQFTWYLDSDSDGYAGTETTSACDAPPGYLATSTDCDDGDDAISPAAAEICDAADTDEDCDGLSDDASAGGQTLWYADEDADGYGSTTSSIACNQPTGSVANATDCDDGDDAIHPVAIEVCDAGDVDEDCNDVADDDDTAATLASMSTWYADTDEDGFGDPTSTNVTCDAPIGFIADGNDCDDADAAIHPDATEICEGASVDEDCDTLTNDDDPSIDEATLATWYADTDGDAYGDVSVVTVQCSQPASAVLDATDCNDGSFAINPGVAEICDAANTDENCSGTADDLDTGATGQATWYVDGDSDDYGVSGTSNVSLCDQPAGYAALSTDCDDAHDVVYPGATEACEDGFDNGCDDVDDCRDDGAYGVAIVGSVDGTYDGASASSGAGFFGAAMSGGRDFNGDAIPDVVIGNREYDTATVDNVGRAYVLNGTATGLPSALSSAFATFTGGASGDRAGQGVAMIDDVDTDGDDELLIGTYMFNNGSVTDAGAVSLVKGNTTGGAYVIASASLTLKGTANAETVGWTVGDAGDLDDDGVEDWFAGAYRFTLGISTGLGRLIVMPGDHADGTWTMSTATPVTIITGSVLGDRLGYAAVGHLDVDGDGYDDLVVGATGTDAVYVFEGPITTSALTRADADSAISDADAVLDSSNLASASQSLSNAGDTNGDGYEELLLGADGWDGSGSLTDAGAAFLFTSPLTTSVASTSAGGQLRGAAASDFVGRGTAGVGDIDGDDFDDVVIGASGYDSPVTGGGVAVVMYGPFVGTTSIGSADVLYQSNVASGALGSAVTALGDVNGDEFADFLFGAPNLNTGSAVQGRVYAVHGTGQ